MQNKKPLKQLNRSQTWWKNSHILLKNPQCDATFKARQIFQENAIF